MTTPPKPRGGKKPAGRSQKTSGAKPALSPAARIALVCVIAQSALLFTIAAGNLLGYLLPPVDRDITALSYLVSPVLFLQGQNMVAVAAIGLLGFLCARYLISRWLFFVLYLAVTVFLLLDQVYFKVFLDHVRLGAFEGGQQFNAAITLGSFVKEIDAIFYLNALVAIAGLAWLAWTMVSPHVGPSRWRLVVEIVGLLFLMGLPAYSSRKYSHLNENPMLVLAREMSQSSVSSLLAQRGADIAAPAAENTGDVDHDPRLPAFLASIQAKKQRPNLILIVLESVGEQNLLDANGVPSPVYTPNLARLAANGVTFDSLYTTFPGTTRSLITLHTGGRQITYSGIAPVLKTYQGPMLARAIGDLGYTTALFSGERLDGEGTDVFLEQAGYQKFYDFAQDILGRQAQNFIHSWGAREEYTLEQVEDWMRSGLPAGTPFYLEYMNAATHHPYGAPPGYAAPLPQEKEGGQHTDYLNALSYTDRAIGSLIDYLRRRGLLKNTVLAVTGDHGEAFGDRHPDNFLHKNFIFEENVRDYLLLADGASLDGAESNPVRSSRIGSTGDIMPTLLALLGAPAPDVPGRNLLSEDLETRVVYFHKLAEPESWGLRDGPWKYIGDIRSKSASLYDLRSDPYERHNLAGQQPDRVARYAAMCQHWYLESDREYTLRVKDYQTVDARLDENARLGARILSVGRLGADHSFVPVSVTTPKTPLSVWVKWTRDFGSDESVEWVSPDGKVLRSPLTEGNEYHVSLSTFPGTLPMDSGTWKVRLQESDGVHLNGQFAVREP